MMQTIKDNFLKVWLAVALVVGTGFAVAEGLKSDEPTTAKQYDDNAISSCVNDSAWYVELDERYPYDDDAWAAADVQHQADCIRANTRE